MPAAGPSSCCNHILSRPLHQFPVSIILTSDVRLRSSSFPAASLIKRKCLSSYAVYDSAPKNFEGCLCLSGNPFWCLDNLLDLQSTTSTPVQESILYLLFWLINGPTLYWQIQILTCKLYYDNSTPGKCWCKKLNFYIWSLLNVTGEWTAIWQGYDNLSRWSFLL